MLEAMELEANDMEIVIRTTNNGIILSTYYSNDESPVENSYDFDDQSLKEEIHKKQQVLYEVIDQLGWYGSKHDQYRLRININENDIPDPDIFEE